AGLTRRERLVWSLAVGLVLQAVCLLLLLAVGTRPTAPKLLLLEAAAAGLGLLLTRSRRAQPPAAAPASGPKSLVLFLACVAGAAWLVFLVGALADAMWATDYLAFWGYKGKIVFLSSEVPRRLFQDPALYFAHREYPLLVPLSLAALASFLGQWNDQAMALLFPVCSLATLSAISGFLERRVSRLSGVAAAALASLCFFLYRPQNAGTAEVPFALGLVLATSAAIDYLQRDRASSAWRLAVASLFCATLKQEGSLFVLLVAGVLWLRMRTSEARVRQSAVAALVLPVSAHWILLYFLRGNQTRRDFDFTLFAPHRWAELPALFETVAGRMLGTEGRNAIVPLLAIAAFFIVTRRGIGDPLLPVFAVQLFFYAVAFAVSSFDPLYAIDGAFRRITMSLFPAFTLVLCARLLPEGATDRSAAAARTPPRPAAETARN
ncbi:MAG: hypothetical protein WAU32_10220, partial [Thermoanaerobaculia bacterium]